MLKKIFKKRIAIYIYICFTFDLKKINLNISINNIISVKVATILWYIQMTFPKNPEILFLEIEDILVPSGSKLLRNAHFVPNV